MRRGGRQGIAAALLLLLGGAGGTARGQAPRSWKSFSNRAGWSMRYPADWTVGSCRACEDPSAPNVYVEFSPPGSDAGAWVTVDHVEDRPADQTPEAWLRKLARTGAAVVAERWLTLDSLPALEVRYRAQDSSEFVTTYVVAGTQTFSIELANARPGAVERVPRWATYRRMLSSFRVRR